MKIFKLLTGIILLLISILLIYTFPFSFVKVNVDRIYFILAGIGTALYLLLHIARKPENFYVWNHEISHLLVSKLFFKDVKGFHITRKRGGKIVVDKTNFLIDLAPYIFYPLIIIFLSLTILLNRAGFPSAIMGYFISIGFFLGMMLAFTFESFLKNQEDIKRNGVIFSASIVLLFNFLFFSLYLLPGVKGKKIFLEKLALLWWKHLSLDLQNVLETARLLFQNAINHLFR